MKGNAKYMRNIGITRDIMRQQEKLCHRSGRARERKGEEISCDENRD
jgi:hypothetical protein